MLSSNRRVGFTAVILAVAFSWGAAEAEHTEVTEIVIHPAEISRRALEYRLSPRLSDQAPGVSAPFYAQAFLALQEREVDDDTWKKMQDQWLKMSLEELPKEEVAKALLQVDTVLRCVDQAARRSRYGLDLPLRDYEQILPTLAPRAKTFRTVARLIVLRFRYKLLEGDYEGAIHSLQTGYAMAWHCAEQPTAFNAMVGHAIVQIMNYRLVELVQLPEAPHLYWTVAALPDPMIDLQPVFDFELSVFESLFPDLEQAHAGDATPDRWRASLVKMVFSPPWREPYDGPLGDRRPFDAEDRVDDAVEKAQPIARRILKAAGASEAELERMSPAEVAVRAVLEYQQTQCDDLGRWCHVPYWQAKAGIERTVDETRRLLDEAGLPKELDRFVPGSILRHVHKVTARSRQGPAGLRCVEAMRLYAATHDGNLPRRLEDITEVPIPVNPMTGRPFPYRTEERYVILDLDGDVFSRQWWIRVAD